jgi:hypothetical protein
MAFQDKPQLKKAGISRKDAKAQRKEGINLSKKSSPVFRLVLLFHDNERQRGADW